MPIYIPGKRDKKRNRIVIAKRNIVTSLSLTSMVDMFTILVVFLLMNYSSTGEIIYIPKDVKLPKASQVKELKPAHVVIITNNEIILDKETIAPLADVKAQTDWMIPRLRERLVQALQDDEITSKKALKNVIPGAMRPTASPIPEESRNKVTVQADRDMDFLTIKKVMFTVTEAGAAEINFAVMKKEDKVPEALETN